MAVDTSEYKVRLQTMLGEITLELKSIGIHNPENSSDWIATPEGVNEHEPDPNIAADRVEEWDERQSIVAALEVRYNNIVRALKRIEEGTYDVCEVCGKPIEEARLDANPAARTDIEHREDESNLPA